MTEWLVQLLENFVLRLAAFIAAAVALAHFGRRAYRAIKTARDNAAELRDDIIKMRAMLHRELNDDGNGSLKSTVNRLMELIVAHFADSELQRHHLIEELRRHGIQIDHLPPRERWRWINEGSRRDRRVDDPPADDPGQPDGDC